MLPVVLITATLLQYYKQKPKLILLHLFTELFHEDFLSLLRKDTALLHTVEHST